MGRLLAIAFLVLLCGRASAESVRFPSVAVGNSPAGPEITGSIYRPSGAGPFPAIILAHGCAGVGPQTEGWGKRLASWGYIALAPDSFGPRGVTSVCRHGGLVSARMRVADIAGALGFLASRPEVRAGQIGLIGHSHGGWTVMRAVQKEYGLAAMGLRAAVAYYPPCMSPSDRDVDVPLLILIGEQDDWSPAERCRRLQAAGFVRPDLVEAVYYPTAYHNFDSPGPDRTVRGSSGMHRLGYDAVAAPDAEARTRAFFARFLQQGRIGP